MIVLGFIIFFILSLIVFLLWAPLSLIINTKEEILKFEWKYIVTAVLIEKDDNWGIGIQLLFFKKFIPIEWFFKTKKAEPSKAKTIKKKEKTSVSPRRMWVIFKKIIRSFEIKTCKINWDTDDYILNAYLYPLTPFISYPNAFFHINFEGKRDIELIIENRIGRILKSFF